MYPMQPCGRKHTTELLFVVLAIEKMQHGMRTHVNVLSSSSIMDPSEVQRSSGDGPAPWSGCSGAFLVSSSVPCAGSTLRMASAF